MISRTTSEKRTLFREMHKSGCFVVPNPWDVGGAKALERIGFKAIATTSAGYAWSQGLTDGQLELSDVLRHMRHMAESTNLPVNADFESGFAETLDKLAENIRMAVQTGVAAISIEDSTGEAATPVLDLNEAVQRMMVARATIDETGGQTMLIGRAENFFVGKPDLEDTIARLRAYSEAGADCLYAPGIKTRAEIRAVVAAVAPKPVNVLVGWNSDLSVQELADLGVRRISLGGALSRVAWGGLLEAARLIAENGRFDGFANIPSGAQLNELFTVNPSHEQVVTPQS